MAEVAEATSTDLTMAEAADLIEMPGQLPEPAPAHDPGQIERTSPSDELSIEQAADLISDDTDDARTNARTVAVIDGKPLTLSDLTTSYALAETYKEVLVDLQGRYEMIAQAGKNVIAGAAGLAEFVASRLPPPPPVTLSYSNPGEHVRRQAAHDESKDVLAQVVERAQQVIRHTDAQLSAISAQAHRDVVAYECRRFLQAFPDKDRAWFDQFVERVSKVAYECDFTEAELRKVVDHRMLRILHFAAIGMEKRGAEPRRRPKPPALRLASSKRELTLAEAMETDFD